MIIQRSHTFTLLETLIAMAMTAIVLTTLTFFYRQVMILNVQAEKIQKEGFELRYIENRFSKIFPSALPPVKKNQDFFFFTVSDPGGIFAQSSPINLIFCYDNGVDLSKQFSNQVLARLFLDAKKRLCLATWPIPSRWKIGTNPPIKFEVLLEDVESLKFWFFIAPDKKWQFEKEKEDHAEVPSPPNPQDGTPIKVVKVNPSPEGDWVQEWSQDFMQLPALIKVEILRRGKVDFFTFPLPKCERQPTYNQ